ncbi:MAG: TolC family protein [Calditrichaceae bacterium]
MKHLITSVLLKNFTPVFGFIFFFSMLSSGITQELLTLDEALQISLENNYSIQISKNTALIAAKNYSAGNAGMLPELDIDAGYNKSKTNSKQNYASGTSIDRTGAESENKTASLELNWTIFDGFKMFHSYSRLGILNNIGQQEFKQQVENSVADVTEAYYDIIRQKLNHDVLQEAVDISKERLHIAEQNFTLGASSKLDLLQARVDLNADRSALLEQSADLSAAMITLNYLLARAVDIEFQVSDSINLLQKLDRRELEESALMNNRAFVIKKKEYEISGEEIGEIKSEKYPEIDLIARYNYAKSESDAGFFISSETDGLFYGVSLTMNLYDGFNTKRRQQTARLIQRNIAIELDEVKNSIIAGIRTGYIIYDNSLTRMQLEEENISAAKENVDIALENFRLGLLTPLELREVQKNYIQAKSRYINAAFEAKQNEINLLKLSGRLITTNSEL